MCKRAATVFCVWALSCPLVTVPSSALSSASAIGDSDRAGESLGLPGGSRRALRHAEGTDARKHAAAPPPPPHHSGLTEALPPSLRQSVIAGVSAESSNTAGIEAASASLSLEVRAGSPSLGLGGDRAAAPRLKVLICLINSVAWQTVLSTSRMVWTPS